MSQLSDGAERLALEQGFAFALVNIAWSVGDSVGAAGGGRLGQSAGDEVPYLILAALCAVTLAGVVVGGDGPHRARRDRGGGYAPALMTARADRRQGDRTGRARRGRARRARSGPRPGTPRPGWRPCSWARTRRRASTSPTSRRRAPRPASRASTTGSPQDAEHAEVEALLRELNDDARVSGILLQLPTPPQVDGGALTELIAPYKDVDGLTPVSAGLLAKGRPGLRPCTPAGVMELLRRHDVDAARGRGRGGRPLGPGRQAGRRAAARRARHRHHLPLAHARPRRGLPPGRRAGRRGRRARARAAATGSRRAPW